MVMTRLSLIVAVILLSVGVAHAQRDVDENSSPLDRIYTGGGLQLSIGSNLTIVGASPIIGYMITPKFSAGLGMTYLYYKFKRPDISTSIYGGKVFARYNVFNPVFLYTEYELLSFDFTLTDGMDNRETVPALNVGGGISQPLGRVAAVQLILLYDLLHDNFKSPAPNAFSVRGGITIGF